MAEPAHWMQSVHPKKGALRATAKRMGLISGGEALTSADLKTLARRGGPKTRERVGLAKAYREAEH